jgi:hypothetical protein
MAAPVARELIDFHAFIGELLKNGSADLLPEEALGVWRERHPGPLDFEDDVAAIQASLDDLSRGEKGMPLEEFDREIRQEFKMPDPRR